MKREIETDRQTKTARGGVRSIRCASEKACAPRRVVCLTRPLVLHRCDGFSSCHHTRIAGLTVPSITPTVIFSLSSPLSVWRINIASSAEAAAQREGYLRVIAGLTAPRGITDDPAENGTKKLLLLLSFSATVTLSSSENGVCKIIHPSQHCE